ncbi:MAG: galactose mutarotase [Phycisphaerae bacterium]|nr:galactose mutarotase [Phycisphaerae bacterium]
MDIKKELFGKLANGEEVDLYILTNDNGLEVRITNYGGIITSLKTPNRKGDFADIVLGHDRLDGYLENNSPYFGAIIGRYANRIAKGRFALGGAEYKLATNDGANHLHGGDKGFDKVLWKAEMIRDDQGVGLKLTYLSEDGQEGYPGNLDCTVIYTLTNADELKISYEAQTDKTTVVNLTNHSYFNLAGHDGGTVYEHLLQVNADNFTPADDTLMPIGEISPVKGSPLDFTSPVAIGSRIERVEGGYDHNYVLNGYDGSLKPAGSVCDPASGRAMEVFTTEPGMQFYSGNFLDGSIQGKGAVYDRHTGFCLETQHFPDSPNQPDFPSTILEPGEKYRQTTIYKFLVK